MECTHNTARRTMFATISVYNSSKPLTSGEVMILYVLRRYKGLWSGSSLYFHTDRKRVGTWTSSNQHHRRHEIIITRLRIGHTRLITPNLHSTISLILRATLSVDHMFTALLLAHLLSDTPSPNTEILSDTLPSFLNPISYLQSARFLFLNHSSRQGNSLYHS